MVINKKSKKRIGLKTVVITGTAVLAAAGYYLYGKNGVQNRKKVKSLANKIHSEVVLKAKKLKSIGESDYHKIVSTVNNKYAGMKPIDKKQLKKIVSDLKKHWRRIEFEAKKHVK